MKEFIFNINNMTQINNFAVTSTPHWKDIGGAQVVGSMAYTTNF